MKIRFIKKIVDKNEEYDYIDNIISIKEIKDFTKTLKRDIESGIDSSDFLKEHIKKVVLGNFDDITVYFDVKSEYSRFSVIQIEFEDQTSVLEEQSKEIDYTTLKVFFDDDKIYEQNTENSKQAVYDQSYEELINEILFQIEKAINSYLND